MVLCRVVPWPVGLKEISPVPDPGRAVAVLGTAPEGAGEVRSKSVFLRCVA